jgi:hypothetical protein
MEWFSSPDRTVTNANKKIGKSTLKGKLYYHYATLVSNLILFLFSDYSSTEKNIEE